MSSSKVPTNQTHPRFAKNHFAVLLTVRTGILAGEALKLSVLLPGIEPREAALFWRPLGSGDFASTPLVHAARSVYSVALPPEATKADLEYYVRVDDTKGHVLYYPATAPKLNQTVVVTSEANPR